MLLRRLRVFWLPVVFYILNLNNEKEDITVVLTVKNRCDFIIVNTMKSIRNQSYDQSLINIILVDYNSNNEFIDDYKRLCQEYKGEYIRVDNRPLWNEAHAHNVGIKRVKTKYCLCTDIDKILEKNFIAVSIKELQKNCLQYIVCNRHNLNNGDIPDEIDIEKNYYELKEKSVQFDPDPGTNLACTYFYKKIKGYDENYKLFFFADNDIMERMQALGLKVRNVSSLTSFIHQGHPEFMGSEEDNIQEQQELNKIYWFETNSILRNKKGWGELS